MQFDINNFPDNCLTFKTVHVKSAKTLWINSAGFINHYGSAPDEAEFLASNSYVIQNSEFFENLTLDVDNYKYLTAERYGGIGLGTNGGGVRCGNHDVFQIKGIGKNPLGDGSKDHWHSYGGLNLVDAIYESIYAYVLNKIMPVGAACVYGIIITGEDSAQLPGNDYKKRSYGALMVRHASIRPAHFIRNQSFTSSLITSKSITNDVFRVRNVNRILASKFGSTGEFIGTIGGCLANHANQFAFARAARLMHGCISASNICLDGQWIDLTNSSFIDGGRNVLGSKSFYNEPDVILGVIDELIYTFSKYNKLNLNSSILHKYYIEQFNAYFKIHIVYVIGLDYSTIPDGVNNGDLGVIAGFISSVIMSAKTNSTDRAVEYGDHDPVICAIESLYLSLSATVIAVERFPGSVSTFPHDLVFSAFKRLTESSYRNSTHVNSSYKSFLKLSAIIALKRTLICEYFYMGRLEGYIYNLVDGNKSDQFIDVINDSILLADWAFEGCSAQENKSTESVSSIGSVTLFKSSQVILQFNGMTGDYRLSAKEASTEFTFEGIEFLFLKLSETGFSTVLSGYSFDKYFSRISFTLSLLDNSMEIVV